MACKSASGLSLPTHRRVSWTLSHNSDVLKQSETCCLICCTASRFGTGLTAGSPHHTVSFIFTRGADKKMNLEIGRKRSELVGASCAYKAHCVRTASSQSVSGTGVSAANQATCFALLKSLILWLSLQDTLPLVGRLKPHADLHAIASSCCTNERGWVTEQWLQSPLICRFGW